MQLYVAYFALHPAGTVPRGIALGMDRTIRTAADLSQLADHLKAVEQSLALKACGPEPTVEQVQAINGIVITILSWRELEAPVPTPEPMDAAPQGTA